MNFEEQLREKTEEIEMTEATEMKNKVTFHAV